MSLKYPFHCFFPLLNKGLKKTDFGLINFIYISVLCLTNQITRNGLQNLLQFGMIYRERNKIS